MTLKFGRLRYAYLHQSFHSCLHHFLSGPTLAEWTYFDGDTETRHYIDIGTLTKNGKSRKVWVMYDLNVPKNGYSSVISKAEFDCKERRYRWLTLTSYFGPMGSGRAIEVDNSKHDWVDIAPNQVFDYALKIVCSN